MKTDERTRINERFHFSIMTLEVFDRNININFFFQVFFNVRVGSKNDLNICSVVSDSDTDKTWPDRGQRL